MGQNLPPVRHLAGGFHNASVVVAIEARPLQLNVPKPSGVKGPGSVIGVNGSPSRLVGCGVLVYKVPTVPAFRAEVREGDHRIMRELLLHVQQVTVDVRRAKRLTPVGVKKRLISAVSVISLPRAGRHGEGSQRHLRRWLEDRRRGRLLGRGVINFTADKAAGHASIKSSIQNIRYLARTGVVVKPVSRTRHQRWAKLHRHAESWSKVVLGSRGIMLGQTGRDPRYGDSVG